MIYWDRLKAAERNEWSLDLGKREPERRCTEVNLGAVWGAL